MLIFHGKGPKVLKKEMFEKMCEETLKELERKTLFLHEQIIAFADSELSDDVKLESIKELKLMLIQTDIEMEYIRLWTN